MSYIDDNHDDEFVESQLNKKQTGMKLIPMEDFIIQMDTEQDERYKREGFKGATEAMIRDWKRAKAYALFLKTPMRYEHFHGRAAVVKIKDVAVLHPINRKTGAKLEGVELIFEPNDEKDSWVGPFSVGSSVPFYALLRLPGVELTEEGVKLIFG